MSKNYIEATGWYKKTLEIEENSWAGAQDLALTYFKLGRVLANQSNYSAAEEYYRKA